MEIPQPDPPVQVAWDQIPPQSYEIVHGGIERQIAYGYLEDFYDMLTHNLDAGFPIIPHPTLHEIIHYMDNYWICLQGNRLRMFEYVDGVMYKDRTYEIFM